MSLSLKPILVKLIDLVDCYNDLTQMAIFLTQIPDCDCHSSALLDLLISSDASLSSTMFYNPSIGKFWSCCCLSFFWLSVKLKAGCPVSLHSLWLFLCWLEQSFWSLEDIFKLSASAAVSEFCEWVQVRIDVYIPHYKWKVKPHSFPCFLAACTAVIVQRNHFFCLHQQNKSSES